MSDSPLRDEKCILRAEALIKLALMGLKPWAEFLSPFGARFCFNIRVRESENQSLVPPSLAPKGLQSRAPGFNPISANLIKASVGVENVFFVPEGQHDRSLARSAWKASNERAVP